MRRTVLLLHFCEFSEVLGIKCLERMLQGGQGAVGGCWVFLVLAECACVLALVLGLFMWVGWGVSGLSSS